MALTRRKKVLVGAVVLAGVAGGLLAFFDHRPLVWKIIDLYNAANYSASARLSHVGGERVTALRDVNVTSFDLSGTAEGGDGRRYGAIEWLGQDRILLGTDYGQFFLTTIAGDQAGTRKLPLRIEINRAALIDHASRNTIRVNPRWLRLDDLLLFDNRQRLAVSYSHWDPERRCVTLRVAVADLPQDVDALTANNLRVIYRSDPCLPLKAKGHALAGHQSGGRIVDLENGKLLVAVGDFEFDGREALPRYPQERSNDYGKMIEIDVATGGKRIISIGHRNPQGLLRDSQARIWSSEHGPRGGDELNRIVEGANYGWPAVSLGVDYVLGHWPLSVRQGRHAQFEPPVFAWVPSIATSQLIEVRNFADEWDGDLLLGGLTTKSLYRIRLEGDAVQYVEPIPIGNRIRDMVQDDTGSIWMWTDEGNLLRLRPQPARAGDAIASLSPAAKMIAQGCFECHDASSSASAPGRIPLGGVVGRRVASVSEVDYSGALRSLGGVWTPQRLDAFIAAPESFAPGTSMPSAPIPDAAARGEIVKLLSTLK